MGFNALEFFPEQPDVMWWWPKGVYRGQKIQLHPTDLTDSTVVRGWNGLGVMADDGSVESVGLFGGLWGGRGSGMNLRVNNDFALHSCQSHERRRKRDYSTKDHRDCDDKCCSRMRLVGPFAGWGSLTN